MTSVTSGRFAHAVAVTFLAAACGGGSDGGGTTNPGPVASVAITVPAAPPTFGALQRTVQFTAVARDAGGLTVPGASITWNSSVPATATVSGTGLVTAVANGTTSVTAASSGFTSPGVTVTVVQVVASIAVTSTSLVPDTLFAATRTRQFSAAARDSTNNALAATVAWNSSAPTVATANAASGLVTAVADGSANIVASVGGINGQRAIIIRRLAQTRTFTPAGSTISTNAGTLGFSGSASDSSGAAIPLTWASRNAAVLTVSPTTGLTTTATGTGNGSTRVVMSIPAGPLDSATVTVSNQVSTAPMAISVTIGDNFFRSVRNNGTPAVDTLAAGGTVTWTWTGSISHSVQSTGAPGFTSSTTMVTGTYLFTFSVAGTYTYDCVVHGALMTGRVVVQ